MRGQHQVGCGERANVGLPNIHGHQVCCALSSHRLVLTPKQSFDMGITLLALLMGKLSLRQTE